MSGPDDPRHGTYAGVKQRCPCAACKKAKADRRRRQRWAAGVTPKLQGAAMWLSDREPGQASAEFIAGYRHAIEVLREAKPKEPAT
jgi:hypothetical protein